MADTELRSLRSDKTLSDAELEEIVSLVSGRAGFAREQAGKPPRNLRAEFARRVKDEENVRAARQRLVDAGTGKEAVASFSAVQVILLDEKREFEVQRDDELKLLGLKLWELGSDGEKKKIVTSGLFADLLPRVGNARRTQGALEHRIAVLRHVEALRMYAASHEGKLPDKLEGIGVPLPPDPFTGKPFAYALTGGTAKLTPGAGVVRYEISLKK
jgi:hypothetical protein